MKISPAPSDACVIPCRFACQWRKLCHWGSWGVWLCTLHFTWIIENSICDSVWVLRKFFIENIELKTRAFFVELTFLTIFNLNCFLMIRCRRSSFSFPATLVCCWITPTMSTICIHLCIILNWFWRLTASLSQLLSSVTPSSNSMLSENMNLEQASPFE